MRKIHDVLRLHSGLHLPQRQIARSVKLSQSTIHDYRPLRTNLSVPIAEPGRYAVDSAPTIRLEIALHKASGRGRKASR
jgi:hypothetical protein